MRHLPHSEMARFTQIDYEREMAFIATRPGPDGQSETLGVVRAITDPDNIRAEFAVLVRSDFKGHGLGEILMHKIIGYCRQRGTRSEEHTSELQSLMRISYAVFCLKKKKKQKK